MCPLGKSHRVEYRWAGAIILDDLDSRAVGLNLWRLADPLPDDVCRFIKRHIHTLEQLEILLLLFRDPTRSWSAAALAAELRTNPESVRTRLGPMLTDGVAITIAATPPTYRFASQSPQLREQVRRVSQYYRERRVAVITQIFAPSSGAGRVFADAFRIKKGDS